MDLGITTYIFLLLNCFLLILGLIRILIAICVTFVSVFVYANMKEVTFSSVIGDTLFLGSNEKAMFTLGILAGFKNNVRLLYTYQTFIGLLAISKILTINQTHTLVAVIKEDIMLSIKNLLIQAKTNDLYMTKIEDTQNYFRCCGLDGPKFWTTVSNYTANNLPRSCCANQNVLCTIEHAWQIGCVRQTTSKFPHFWFGIHIFTLYPLFEILLFLVGVMLIFLIKKTAANTLA